MSWGLDGIRCPSPHHGGGNNDNGAVCHDETPDLQAFFDIKAKRDQSMNQLRLNMLFCELWNVKCAGILSTVYKHESSAGTREALDRVTDTDNDDNSVDNSQLSLANISHKLDRGFAYNR